MPVTLADLKDDPGEYYGQGVTVDGAVVRVIGPRVSIVLSSERLAQLGEVINSPNADPQDLTDEGVLVVNTSGPDPNLDENQVVEVTGMVRRFDAETLNQELGVEPYEEELAAFSGRPASWPALSDRRPKAR